MERPDGKALKKAHETDLDFKANTGRGRNFIRRNDLKMRCQSDEGDCANEASSDLARHAIP